MPTLPRSLAYWHMLHFWNEYAKLMPDKHLAFAGDKESFWMAFELASIPYYFDSAYASAIGNVTLEAGTGQTMVCPCHILHLDQSGKPFWYNGSLFRNKRASKTDRQWMYPQIWAADTGSWEGVFSSMACMRGTEGHGAPKALSEGGYVAIYKQMVEVAKQTDFNFDALIS